jgi:hypothetical protein
MSVSHEFAALDFVFTMRLSSILMDPSNAVRDAIAALEREEKELLDQHQRTEVRLTQVRTAKAALVALENEEPIEFDGKLADAARIALKSVGRRSLTPTEVRDAVKALGYNIEKHTNQMAAVHSVLKRLHEANEAGVKELPQAPGQRRYYWAANFTEPVPPGTTGAASFLDAANKVIAASKALNNERLMEAINASANVMSADWLTKATEEQRALIDKVEKAAAQLGPIQLLPEPKPEAKPPIPVTQRKPKA